MTQPNGAIRTVATGSYADAIFSSDGSRLYAVSGNTVSVIDVATGSTITHYTVGTSLAGMDLSPDGHYLAVVEGQTGTSGTLYRIDLTSGIIATYSAPLGTQGGAFYDVAYLSDGTALISAQGTNFGTTPFRLLDFTMGSFTIPAGNASATNLMSHATLTSSADHSHVFAESIGYQTSSYVYVTGTGFVAQTAPTPSDPYAGAALRTVGSDTEAISPDGSLYVDGQTLNVYDSSLHMVRSLSGEVPFSPEGLAFSADGHNLYLASGSALAVVDTSTWQVIGIYRMAAATQAANQFHGFGDIVQASPDGHDVSIIGTTGIQLVDLTQATFESTQGNDTISGSGNLYGLGGDDDLSGNGTSTMMSGGSGNDTFHITTFNDQAGEGANQGHDTVHTVVSYTLGANLEDLVLDGAAAIDGNGNDLDNIVTGNDAANQIYGAGGDDHIYGGGGNDTLEGGAGNDVLDGGAGLDTASYRNALTGVAVNLGSTGPQDTVGAGTDTLINVEGLTGSFYDDHLTGGGAADTISGSFGNDTVTGGLGRDTLSGESGNDTFLDTTAGLNGDTILDFDAGDKIVVSDATLSSFSFSLNGNVLTYSGGSLTLGAPVAGALTASAAPGGGVQLTVVQGIVATDDQIATQLTDGYWGGTTHHWPVTQGGTITVDISTLTAAEQMLARTALSEWSDLIGVHFQEVTTGAQIQFTDTEDASANGPVAETFSQWSNGLLTSATVQISRSWITQYGSGINSYSFQSYIHEIGHALGLGHAGSYNVTATYPNDAMFQNDAWSTSIMSYFSPQENTYFARQGFSSVFALTPMMADVLAIQDLYGSPTIIRSGDTVYGDNSNAGGVYDAVAYPGVAVTVFDSGGTDTLDYSRSGATQLINLNPETFSNVSGYVGNLSIARGTIIENAIGGSGSDLLIGNAASNVLTGNGGHDTLAGGAGNDTFRDTAAGLSGDTITDLSACDRIVVTDANIAGFTFSLTGNTLDFSGGSLTLSAPVHGGFVAMAATGGGVGLRLHDPANDFDGDGRSDVLWLSDGGQLTNWLGTSSGGFASNWVNANMLVGSGWHVAATGDFDGDHRDDILWRSDDGTVTDWLASGSGSFATNWANANLSLPSSWHVAGAGDFNGDGMADILWRDDSGALVDWLATGSGGFSVNSAGSGASVPSNWQVAGIGDFNGDGTADILWHDDNGVTTDWLGNGSGGFTTNWGNAGAGVPLDWKVAATGDFNGDGYGDVLWRNDNGLIVSWLGNANGGFAADWAHAPAGVGPEWSIAAVGDYNGDAHDDILWRNTSGQLTQWLGNSSGTFTDNSATAAASSTGNWHVVSDGGGLH